MYTQKYILYIPELLPNCGNHARPFRGKWNNNFRPPSIITFWWLRGIYGVGDGKRRGGRRRGQNCRTLREFENEWRSTKTDRRAGFRSIFAAGTQTTWITVYLLRIVRTQAGFFFGGGAGGDMADPELLNRFWISTEINLLKHYWMTCENVIVSLP